MAEIYSHCLGFMTLPSPLPLHLKGQLVERLKVGEGAVSVQGQRVTALEGKKVQGAIERENQGWCYQILNSYFCCELSHHFSVFRNKASTLCSP